MQKYSFMSGYTLKTQDYVLSSDVDQLISEHKKEIKRNTWCAYCGYEINIDDEAATKISEHIMSCPKHPIRIAFDEIEKLKKEIDRLTAELAEER
jgi:hypothetical protein